MVHDDPFPELERWLKQPLSQKLRAILLQLDGRPCDGRMVFYAPDELLERNETYETQKYCPGWLTIGDDSGGRAIVVSPSLSPPTVFLVDHGDMTPEAFMPIAERLSEWTENLCGDQVIDE